MEDTSNWFEDAEDDDMLLSRVTGTEISALGDGYDDMRIDVLASAYLKLRLAYVELEEMYT
jgi:hypothetical protein